ncbi:MAG TPA: DUF393 domain-containing protein [Abditibacteriaceae bacterium]|jgi:predicted DCC family thiol-disulfide oxidoreductase YuxK
MKSDESVLIYDGDCAFCTRSANLMQRLAGKRLKITPSQAEGALQLHPNLTQEGAAQRVYLVSGKRLFGGAEAVARVLALRRWGGIALIYYFPPLRPLLDAIYDLVARNRQKLGCGDSCSLR